ncbi:MAG: hypothetical protein JKY65_22045 [Planctomycetes bacterium]|nr:hypothetical protein [Planctomycetota bacterium]
MRNRPLLVVLVPLSLLLGLWLGGLPGADAQDRSSRYERGTPLWGKALIEAIKVDTATKPRYEYHPRGETTVVFDTQTGVSYSLVGEKAKTVRIEDPIAGRVVLRRAERIDQTVGGVIRAR